MTKNPKKEAYYSHKHHAKERGIPFLFTLKEWTAWWEKELGPDWFQKRGCKAGEYVMARLGDEGPYAPDNVKCILHTSNSSERKRRGCLMEAPDGSWKWL
jgi:hypothetical protein